MTLTSFSTPRGGFALPPLFLALFCSAALAGVNDPQSSQAPQSVLVTASRSAQPVTDVLLDHEIISAQEIRNAGFSSIAELLQKKRGVEIASNGGPGSNASVFLRGSDTKQTVVLVDGVRVGASTTGGATWATIPLSQIDHVEIVYGPLSSLYGADAVGGVVQIFTKPGSTYLEPTAAIGFGSHASRSQDVGVSGSSGGDHALRFALNVAHEVSDGFSVSKPGAGPYTYNADKDGYSRKSASGQLGWKLTPDHELGGTFLYSRLAAQFDAGPDYDDRSVEKLENVALHLKSQFLPGWHSQLQVSRSADRNATDASFGASVFDTVRRHVSWQHDLKLGPDLFQLVLEHDRERVESSEVALEHSRTTRSIGGLYQLRRGAHSASLGLRRDNNSQYGGRTTGSVAYGYRIDAAWRVGGSFGTSFRAPAFNELYFPGFGLEGNRPERGRNGELNLHYAAGPHSFSASWFHNRTSNLLVYAPVCPVEAATHPFGCAYNTNSALVEGVSLGAGTRWQQFSLRGSLDWQDPKDETLGKRLARRARQHGSVTLEYQPGNRLLLGAEAVFSSSRFDDAASRNRLGGYGVLNLYGNYPISQRWTVTARWNNVGSKDYELARFYNTDHRNAFIGLRYGEK
jgi:vitamin B12 transporter